MTETDEFSFVLKPSKHGVGVFAVHDIAKGTPLRLFGDSNQPAHWYRTLEKHAVPKHFHQFCLDREEGFICPPDFGVMPIGWYMNHGDNFNAERGENTDPNRKFQWHAIRDIKAGEEILIDYNTIEERDSAEATYYRS